MNIEYTDTLIAFYIYEYSTAINSPVIDGVLASDEMWDTCLDLMEEFKQSEYYTKNNALYDAVAEFVDEKSAMITIAKALKENKNDI